MTVNELISRAEEMVEEYYENNVWYGFIDHTLKSLTPAAKVLSEGSHTTTLNDGDATILFHNTVLDIYEVISVSFQPSGSKKRDLRKILPHDNVSAGWVRMTNKIILQNLPWDAGDTFITYYANLKRTADGDNFTVNLPEQYDDVLFAGVCALAMQKEEELSRKEDYYQEFLLGKRNMLAERTYEMEPWNRAFVADMKWGDEK